MQTSHKQFLTLPKTHIDPDCLTPWKMVFLYQPVVFRVHVSLPSNKVNAFTANALGVNFLHYSCMLLWDKKASFCCKELPFLRDGRWEGWHPRNKTTQTKQLLRGLGWVGVPNEIVYCLVYIVCVSQLLNSWLTPFGSALASDDVGFWLHTY